MATWIVNNYYSSVGHIFMWLNGKKEKKKSTFFSFLHKFPVSMNYKCIVLLPITSTIPPSPTSPPLSLSPILSPPSPASTHPSFLRSSNLSYDPPPPTLSILFLLSHLIYLILNSSDGGQLLIIRIIYTLYHLYKSYIIHKKLESILNIHI